jgi:TRAP transporter TAXI family solute receptor
MRNLLAVLSCLLACAAHADTPQLTKFLALGTASESGVFHPVGKAVCDAINRDRMAQEIRCLPYTSGGSVYNVHALLSGELDLGITRSDLAYQAYHGQGDFSASGPARDLRIIAALYGMPVTVIARRAAGIRRIEDIAGKRVNLGNRGSGQRNIVEMLMRALDLTPDDFAATAELTTSEMGKEFCAGRIDVMVEALGNPAAFYRHAIEECDGVVVPIAEPVLARILSEHPHLGRLDVPAGIYRGHDRPLPSFGFKAVLVALAGTDNETIRRVGNSLRTHLDRLRAAHPALGKLDFTAMTREGVTIPLHEGMIPFGTTGGMRQ